MAIDFDALDLVRSKNKAKMHEKKKAMSKKPEGWAVVVTWEREDKTWYTETITGSAGVMTISNTAACNWSMVVNLIEYEVARGYIDINAG